ncbi:hypothetical protein QFZ63_004026 [Streptomyces sp. B3I7]|uniref:hypothetical protein n=1 Tax=Streptomyces sp. B3I7 TaxID=3042269 RepID=UPI002783D665|nr:hypothetical protein [Streptomyces sp. B3I7]MDQ0812312.1 hypothetical protein [Streptomyces sp. B3I7]
MLVHGRFVDRLSRDAGQWRIAHRAAVHDSATFTCPYGFMPVDESVVHRFPREYAPLSDVLEVSGFETGECPTRGLATARTGPRSGRSKTHRASQPA